MRDSTIFYRSFFEAISELEAKDKLILYDAIFQYSLNFIEPKLDGIARTVFTLIKPQIDANIERWKNGNKPKSNLLNKRKGSKREAKNKQDGSKHEANANVNVNVNDSYVAFLSELNRLTNKNYRGAKSVLASFAARIGEGRTLDDFFLAMRNAVNDQHHIDSNFKWLTPEFFTRATKLDKFVNQAEKPKPILHPVEDMNEFFGTKSKYD